MEEILSLLIGNQNQCCETCGHSCKDNKDWEIYWREKLVEFEKKTEQDFLKRILPEERPMNVFSFCLKGEELERYMQNKGHNKCREELLTNASKEGVTKSFSNITKIYPTINL